jgi:hypothetical protein
MNRQHRARKTPSRNAHRALLLAWFVVMGSGVAGAQATGQYSGGSSVSSGNANPAKTPGWTAATPARTQSASPHLAVAATVAPEVANRRALEQRAGEDAVKLLLRSTPSGARVWIDGAFLGTTPTLIVLAPGKYLLEMKGERQDSAARVIDLLPRETRDIALQLTARYPTHVSTR